jgi:hypothetical protein
MRYFESMPLNDFALLVSNSMTACCLAGRGVLEVTWKKAHIINRGAEIKEQTISLVCSRNF